MSSSSNNEQKVISWIADWRRVSPAKLSMNTCVNCGLLSGLGIDGADAIELVRNLSEKSGLPFDDFQFDRYFGPELSLASIVFHPRVLLGRRRLSKLRIRDIVEYMNAKANDLPPL